MNEPYVRGLTTNEYIRLAQALACWEGLAEDYEKQVDIFNRK